MVDHVAFVVSSIQASCDWYARVLGVCVEHQDDDWAMLTIPGSEVKIALTLQGTHPPHVAFRKELVTVDGTKTHRDGSKYLYVSDPDGNTIEFIDWEYQ